MRCINADAGQAIQYTCEGPVSPIIMLLARHECRKKKPEKKIQCKILFHVLDWGDFLKDARVLYTNKYI